MKKGEPIVQLAVYDYETAIIADRVGIDILCVSDTGGMVLFGHESTTSVSFEEVMFMAQAVKRGSKYGLRMVDMPYMSFHLSAQQAVDNAAKYVSQGGAEVMKCEGNQHHAKYIEAIVKAGIPVQGHIGITPMRMPQLGGFFAQGKTADRAKELVDDALGDGRRRLLLDHVRGDDVGSVRVPRARRCPCRWSRSAPATARTACTSSARTSSTSTRRTCRAIRRSTSTSCRSSRRASATTATTCARAYPGPEHTVFMKEDELAKFRQMVGWKQSSACEHNRGAWRRRRPRARRASSPA